MSRPLPTDSLSLTGAGAALVTDAAGSIEPLAVAGLIVDDVRFVSRWRIDAVGAITQLVGRERVGPSSDRLIFTIVLPESIDPIGTFERTRTVTGRGLREELRVELVAEQARFADEQSQRRDTFQRAVAEALSEMDARHLAAYAALRKDVETVAIQTEAEFQQLAVSDQPRTRSVPRDQ